MPAGMFFRSLLITTCVSLVLMAITSLFMDVWSHLAFLTGSLFFFVLLAVMVFFMARRGRDRRSGDQFLFIVVFNVFLKLVAAFTMVFLYARYGDPGTKLFVIPFLEIYLVFTIFETWFLSKQARVR